MRAIFLHKRMRNKIIQNRLNLFFLSVLRLGCSLYFLLYLRLLFVIVAEKEKHMYTMYMNFCE